MSKSSVYEYLMSIILNLYQLWFRAGTAKLPMDINLNTYFFVL